MNEPQVYAGHLSLFLYPSFFWRDREKEKDAQYIPKVHSKSLGFGHQGSSAAYPSQFSYVTLDHLRDAHADGSAHSLNNCAFEERSAKDLDSDYIENVANTTGPSRKTGKDSRSIIGASSCGSFSTCFHWCFLYT